MNQKFTYLLLFLMIASTLTLNGCAKKAAAAGTGTVSLTVKKV